MAWQKEYKRQYRINFNKRVAGKIPRIFSERSELQMLHHNVSILTKWGASL